LTRGIMVPFWHRGHHGYGVGGTIGIRVCGKHVKFPRFRCKDKARQGRSGVDIRFQPEAHRRPACLKQSVSSRPDVDKWTDRRRIQRLHKLANPAPSRPVPDTRCHPYTPSPMNWCLPSRDRLQTICPQCGTSCVRCVDFVQGCEKSLRWLKGFSTGISIQWQRRTIRYLHSRVPNQGQLHGQPDQAWAHTLIHAKARVGVNKSGGIRGTSDDHL